MKSISWAADFTFFTSAAGFEGMSLSRTAWRRAIERTVPATRHVAAVVLSLSVLQACSTWSGVEVSEAEFFPRSD